MHEETLERLAEVEAAARDARDWIAETIDRCLAGQRVDLEPLTLAHQRLEGLNLGDGEHPYVCGECFAVGPEQHAATCTEGRRYARQHGVDLDGEPVLNQGDEDDPAARRKAMRKRQAKKIIRRQRRYGVERGVRRG